MSVEFLRRLIADGCCQKVGADGFGLLSWLAAQPQPVELSRDEMSRRAGLSKRKAIDVLRVAIAAGWVAERAGIGRASCALTCIGLGPVVTTTTRVVSVGVSSGDALPVEPTPVVVPVESVESSPVSTSAAVADRPKRSSRSTVAPAIPVELAGEAFAAAWQRWKTHRSEKRSTLTPSTEALQLKKLAAVGPEVACWAIEQSIANGWIGLFPDRFTNQTQGKAASNANNRIGTGQRFKG